MRKAAVASLAVLAVSAALVGGLAVRQASAYGGGSGTFAKDTTFKFLSFNPENPDTRNKYPTSFDLSFEGSYVYAYMQYETPDWLYSYELSGYCGNGRLWFTNGGGVTFDGTITGTAPRRLLKVSGHLRDAGSNTEVKFAAREVEQVK